MARAWARIHRFDTPGRVTAFCLWAPIGVAILGGWKRLLFEMEAEERRVCREARSRAYETRSIAHVRWRVPSRREPDTSFSR